MGSGASEEKLERVLEAFRHGLHLRRVRRSGNMQSLKGSQQLVFAIFSKPSHLLQNGHHIVIQRILAQHGIPGSESADAAAKAGHKAATDLDIPFLAPDARIVIYNFGNAIAKA